MRVLAGTKRRREPPVVVAPVSVWLPQRVALEILQRPPLACAEAAHRRAQVLSLLPAPLALALTPDMVTPTLLARLCHAIDTVSCGSNLFRSAAFSFQVVEHVVWGKEVQPDVQAETTFKENAVLIIVARAELRRLELLIAKRLVTVYGWVPTSLAHFLVLCLEHELCHAMIGPSYLLPPHGNACVVKRAFFRVMGDFKENSAHCIDFQELANAAFSHTWIELKEFKHPLPPVDSCFSEILSDLTTDYGKSKTRTYKPLFDAFKSATEGAGCAV